MKLLYVFLALGLFSLTGCSYISNKLGYVEKTKLEQSLENAKLQKEKELKEKELEIKTALNEVINNKDSQMQSAANSLYGASLTRPHFKEETRPLLIVFNRIDEAKSALGVGPTVEAMREEQARLLKELDEKLTSIEELKKINLEKIKENEILVANTLEKQKIVDQLEKEKDIIIKKADGKIETIQKELNKKNDQLIDKEKENSENKKYIESNKRLIMSICGIISLAALAGGIFSPVFKKELGLLSAITGIIAVTIPFLQPIHVGIVFGLSILYIFLKMERKGAVSLKTNENLINAIQSIKETKPELYESELKPELEEWNKKYDGDKKVLDEKVTSHIENILKDYERK